VTGTIWLTKSKIFTTWPFKEKVYIPGLEVVQTSEKEGQELQYDEEVEFDFVIRNISNENVKKDLLTLEIMNYMDENLVPLP